MTKIAGILFAAASLGMFILIIIYIFVYNPPTGNWQEKLNHLNEHWILASTIWRFEFLAVVIYAFIAFYFSQFNPWWYLVAIGHLFMLFEYALMLGGYPNVLSKETFRIVNEMAIWVFAGSNFIWLTGMTGVYLKEQDWLPYKYVGAGLTFLCSILYMTMVLGFTTMSDLFIVGPLVLILYPVNAYYGLRILQFQRAY